MGERQAVFLSGRDPKGDVTDYWCDLKERVSEVKQLRWARLCLEMCNVHKDNPSGVEPWLKEVFENKEADFLSGEADGESLRTAFTSLLPDELRVPREARTLPPIKAVMPTKKRKRPPTLPAAPTYVDKAVQTYAQGDFDILSLEDMQTPKMKKKSKVIDFTTSQPMLVSGDSDGEDAEDAEVASASAKEAHIPTEEYEKLRVTCPPLKDCEGAYQLQSEKVNGHPWWSFTQKPGVEWKLYSSPKGMWTITRGDRVDFRTGKGLVAAGSYHENKMPYVNDDHQWQSAQFGMWRAHPGIRVDSLCSSDVSRLVISKFGSNGHLKKRALSRLIRHSLNDPYMPPVSDETYAKFCTELKADPEVGIPAESLSAWFTSSGITQQLSQTQTQTSGASSGFAQSGSSASEAQPQSRSQQPVPQPQPQPQPQQATKPSRGFAARCGECRSCRNPRWKKSCENPPKRSSNNTATSNDPISSYSSDNEDGESDDAVAKLLGMRILRNVATEAAPPRPNRIGYAFGVPLGAPKK